MRNEVLFLGKGIVDAENEKAAGKQAASLTKKIGRKIVRTVMAAQHAIDQAAGKAVGEPIPVATPQKSRVEAIDEGRIAPLRRRQRVKRRAVTRQPHSVGRIFEVVARRWCRGNGGRFVLEVGHSGIQGIELDRDCQI